MVCFFHFVMRFRHLKNSPLIENNGFATTIRLPALKSAEKVNPQGKLCAKVALLDDRPPATRRNALGHGVPPKALSEVCTTPGTFDFSKLRLNLAAKTAEKSGSLSAQRMWGGRANGDVIQVFPSRIAGENRFDFFPKNRPRD